ncbi:hypothetical protein E2C01_017514 [Portunus trituberculatus]|uniref:Uncharacterized protein n=1 Tax=Portunus trituberculatus TaxID=210409 RepID=A0A5B7DTP6_PORTR|nr:hypothetical protein [Portunus trituberculatus]
MLHGATGGRWQGQAVPQRLPSSRGPQRARPGGPRPEGAAAHQELYQRHQLVTQAILLSHVCPWGASPEVGLGRHLVLIASFSHRSHPSFPPPTAVFIISKGPNKLLLLRTYH